jgi:hypothetical protein
MKIKKETLSSNGLRKIDDLKRLYHQALIVSFIG